MSQKTAQNKKKHIYGGSWLIVVALIATTAVYVAGLSGSYLFDDYPNIVDNLSVQPRDASFSELVRAALSSPSSELKRPMASISFAINYLITGLNPYWMKLTNLIIHLLNGLLVFLLTQTLILNAGRGRPMSLGRATNNMSCSGISDSLRFEGTPESIQQIHSSATAHSYRDENTIEQIKNAGIVAALVATGWMLLPINLTGVLYVVQRMESMANAFVLLGLIGYTASRRRMLSSANPLLTLSIRKLETKISTYTTYLILCFLSITAITAIGILAKETAVMLPLYALLIEWTVFRFELGDGKRDWRLVLLFLVILVVPLMLGLVWLFPVVFNPATWSTRDFTLTTRLLSEARIVSDYVRWTLVPTLDALSFYHDDFHISTGLFTPWTTFASIVFLAALIALTLWARRRQPLAALGIALFLGCQLLTGTILPLELIYEHRNYFASFGLMLAVIPLLAVPRSSPFRMPRYVLLSGLMLCWGGLTATTAYAWGNPLRLAEELAQRAPQSPRAEYELGRTYIIYSRYDPASPFTRLAYEPLERAAGLPDSSILPEQALIFMNARMGLPIKDEWWNSIIAKLTAHKPTIQDESSLGALTQCVREGHCDLPKSRMVAAYAAALAHPNPSARLQAMYGDYAWNVLDDHVLGERMTDGAVKTAPKESAYLITLVRMLVAQGRLNDARAAFRSLQSLDIGGSLETSINELSALPGMQ